MTGRCGVCLRFVVGVGLLVVLGGEVVGAGFAVQARLAVKEGVLLDGAAADLALVVAELAVAVVRGCGRRDVGDLLGHGMLAADGRDANV